MRQSFIQKREWSNEVESLKSKGSRVVVVEDVVTTGGSVKEVIGLVENLGSSVVAVGSIIDRSNGEADFKCHFENILKVNVESFDADECPLCKQGSAPYKPGSRKE